MKGICFVGIGYEITRVNMFSILILEYVFFMAELLSSCHQDTKARRKNEVISLCLCHFVANCFGYFRTGGKR